MVMKKGLSGVIGILIILLIMIAIVVPVMMIITSQPTAQEKQINNVLPYKNLAQEQYNDFQPIQIVKENVSTRTIALTLPPIYFAYGNNSVYFIFSSNISPPIPLIVKYLSVFNGSQWIILNISHQGNRWWAEVTDSVPSGGVLIAPNESNTKYFGFSAIQIQLPVQPYEGQPSFVSTITQYGDMIYASPISSLIFPFKVISGNYSSHGISSQWISSSTQGFYESFCTFINAKSISNQISNIQIFYATVTQPGVLSITFEPNQYISKAILSIGNQSEEIYPSTGYFYLEPGNYTGYITLYFNKQITSQITVTGTYNYTTPLPLFIGSYLYNFYLTIDPNN